MTILDPPEFEGLMIYYLGQLHATTHDFNELLRLVTNVKKELENRSMFFMTLGLYGLPQGYVATCDKILGLTGNPT